MRTSKLPAAGVTPATTTKPVVHRVAMLATTTSVAASQNVLETVIVSLASEAYRRYSETITVTNIFVRPIGLVFRLPNSQWNW